jgi:hypothetical protein
MRDQKALKRGAPSGGIAATKRQRRTADCAENADKEETGSRKKQRGFCALKFAGKRERQDRFGRLKICGESKEIKGSH